MDLEHEADLLDFYFIATILDPRFKNCKFLQSKNSKRILCQLNGWQKQPIVSRWSLIAYGQLRELRCQNLLKLLLQRTLGLLFLPKKNMVLVEGCFQDDADKIASKPIMSCKEECDQYLSIPAVSARSDPLVWW